MPQNHLSYKPLSFFSLIMVRRNAVPVACPGLGILLSQFWHEAIAFSSVRCGDRSNLQLEQQRLSDVEVSSILRVRMMTFREWF
jgi:hypothetical protein